MRSAGLWKRWVVLSLLAVSVTLGSLVDAQIRDDVKTLLDEGLKFFRQGQLDEAETRFQKALLLDPGSDEALEWIETVGYQQLIRMAGEGNEGLAAAAREIMELTSREYRKRSRDEQKIRELLDGYFSGNLAESVKLRSKGIADHGVYLIPGLVERLASAEAQTRTRAILAIRELDQDAVVPLCRALHHPDPIVVQGAVACLQHIGHPEATPSLQWIAQTSTDLVTKNLARDALQKLRSGGGDAYDLLVKQARRFYLDSSYLYRTYHDPIIWKCSEGSIVYEDVNSWAVNELVASQFIEDALAMDPARTGARVTDLCIRVARFAEFERVREHYVTTSDEAQLAKLTAEEKPIQRVLASAFAAPSDIMFMSLDQALIDRKPEVATGILDAIRSGLPEGKRASQVPPVLTRALQYADHRGVRFDAAECLAWMNPEVPFQAMGEVVPELCEGLVVAGTRVALTVLPSEDDRQVIHGALQSKSHVIAFNEREGSNGINRARNFPPEDLILLAAGSLGDMTTAEAITSLRGDPRTRDIPILVVSDDDSLTKNRGIYENADNRVQVISRSIDPVHLRDAVLKPLWQSDERARGRSANTSARAARALYHVASRETLYSLEDAEPALVSVLANRSDNVRIPAIRALRCLETPSAVPELLELLLEDGNSVELQVACYRALGDIDNGTGSMNPEMSQILQRGQDHDDPAVQKASFQAEGKINGGPR